jgi:hypothetical protein
MKNLRSYNDTDISIRILLSFESERMLSTLSQQTCIMKFKRTQMLLATAKRMSHVWRAIFHPSATARQCACEKMELVDRHCGHSNQFDCLWENCAFGWIDQRPMLPQIPKLNSYRSLARFLVLQLCGHLDKKFKSSSMMSLTPAANFLPLVAHGTCKPFSAPMGNSTCAN